MPARVESKVQLDKQAVGFAKLEVFLSVWVILQPSYRQQRVL